MSEDRACELCGRQSRTVLPCEFDPGTEFSVNGRVGLSVYRVYLCAGCGRALAALQARATDADEWTG